MQFLQTGPIDTTSYMIMGFAVIFGALIIYLASLVIRQRGLEEDYRVLQEIDTDASLDSEFELRQA